MSTGFITRGRLPSSSSFDEEKSPCCSTMASNRDTRLMLATRSFMGKERLWFGEEDCSQSGHDPMELVLEDCGDEPSEFSVLDDVSEFFVRRDLVKSDHPYNSRFRFQQLQQVFHLYRSQDADHTSQQNGLQQFDRKIIPTGLGAGLRNIGKNCFMNAILQCFTHSVILMESLVSSNHMEFCESGCRDFCVLCAMCHHVAVSLSYSGRAFSPYTFFDNLHRILFLCFLISLSSISRYEQSCFFFDIVHENYASSSGNIVQNIFGGCLVSKLRCCNCGYSSDKHEQFTNLSLEIEDMGTLEDALESFTSVEKIEDSEINPFCEKCEKKTPREKKLMIHRVPLIAIFHLKRFKHDGVSFGKINKHVEFPLELDLRPYANEDQDNTASWSFHLYAVVVHHGCLPTSGHYFCYIRSSPNSWNILDDAEVCSCEEEVALSEPAYILLYTRESTPWFSSLMKDVINRMVTSEMFDSEDFELASTSGSDSLSREMIHSYETEEPYLRDEDGSGHEKLDELLSSYHEERCIHAEIDIEVVVPETKTSIESAASDADLDKLPENHFRISRDHLKVKKRRNPTSLQTMADGNSDRMEAMRYLKTVSSGRSSILMAAIISPNDQKKRTGTTCKSDSQRNLRAKQEHHHLLPPKRFLKN